MGPSKIPAEKKGKTFVDCDDLMNLTRLFGYVGQAPWRSFRVVGGHRDRRFCRFFFVVGEKSM